MNNDNIALMNFMMNTLRGMSTGGSIGSQNATEFGLFKDMDLLRDAMHRSKVVMPVLFGILSKFMEGMQGLNHTFTWPSRDSLRPPITPITGKVPSVFGSRKAG